MQWKTLIKSLSFDLIKAGVFIYFLLPVLSQHLFSSSSYFCYISVLYSIVLLYFIHLMYNLQVQLFCNTDYIETQLKVKKNDIKEWKCWISVQVFLLSTFLFVYVQIDLHVLSSGFISSFFIMCHQTMAE